MILLVALVFSSCKKDDDDDDDDDNGNSGVTCDETVTDIDGNVYGVVGIGNQCWMQENLKTTRYNDGEVIPNLIDNEDWTNTNNGAWVIYENEQINDQIYGKLYNWYAVSTGKLCPEGWRVPTIADWEELWEQVDFDANKLKAIPIWNPQSADVTNESGFSALPGGSRVAGGIFVGGNSAYFYGAESINSQDAYSRSLFSDSDFMFENIQSKKFGYSCRCIKSEEDTSGFDCLNGSCSEVDSDATYATLADCQSECASTAGYNCQGGNCVAVNQNATYVSLSACISNCSGSNAGYNCNGGSCVSVSSNATYADLASCQSACAQDCNIQVAIISQTSSSATAEASGGNPPYNYIWSNGDTGPTATNLSPGSTYTVIASEVSNSECMDMIQVTIEGSSGGDCCDCTGIGFACDVCCDGEFDMIGLSWAEWEAIFADSGCDCN